VPRIAATTLLTLLVLAAPASAAPKRIVALTPFSANTVAELGVRPVAIGHTLGGNERFSRKLRGVPKLALSHPNGPNLEQLAELRPKLVFSSPTWRKGAVTMRRLKMRVEEVDPPRLADLPAATRYIGHLIGRVKPARRFAARLTREIRAATRGIRSRPEVLMVLGVGRTPFAFLPNSWGGDVIRRAGGRLVTGGAKAGGGFARISDEKILEADPDVIIAVPHGNPGDLDRIEEELRNNQYWKFTKAGQTGAIHVSTDNSLLQAGTDVGRTIRTVRQRYLKNW
jgi:ABC-type Fe3+-hydroxamate transport system substrate-binding protein